MKFIVLMLMSIAFLPVQAQITAPASTVEIQKTNTVIEFQANFASCPGVANFRVQDGVMATFNINGSPVVRFIAKKYGPGNVKLHVLEESEAVIAGKTRKGLKIGEGIDMLSSVSLEALEKNGVKSLQYRSDYSMTGEQVAKLDAANAASAAGPTTNASNCCCFEMCNKQTACVCSAGFACIFDGCGGCCVNGGDPFP